MLTSRVWGLTGLAAQNHPAAGWPLPKETRSKGLSPQAPMLATLQTQAVKTAFSCRGTVFGDCLCKCGGPRVERLESRACGSVEYMNLAVCLRVVINKWSFQNMSIKQYSTNYLRLLYLIVHIKHDISFWLFGFIYNTILQRDKISF